MKPLTLVRISPLDDGVFILYKNGHADGPWTTGQRSALAVNPITVACIVRVRLK